MANLFLNKVILCGRLTADPELKVTPSNKSVVTITLAIQRGKNSRGEDLGADFINVVFWDKAAENVTRFFTKGKSLYVEGRLNIRKWTDNENQNHFTTEVYAESWKFVDNVSTTSDSKSDFEHQVATNDNVPEGFETVKSDAEIPF